MRAPQAPPPHGTTARGKVYRRAPPPSSFSTLCAPSPTSASSASSSSSSSRSSGSYGAARPRATSRGAPQPPPSLPTSGALMADDDSDLWASIRLASSPPKSVCEPPPTGVRASARLDRESSFASLLRSTGTPHKLKDDTAMLPLVIDDFSQERMGRVPTVKPPPLAQQPKALSWSIGRRPHKADMGGSSSSSSNPPSSTPPLARAHSADSIALTATAAAPHDISLMDHRVFVSRDQWVPHRDRRACVVCDRDFGMLRKKHSCRMCGDVVCSRCSLFKNVKLPGVVGESKARVCSRCFLQYRQRVLCAAAPRADKHHEEARQATHTSDSDRPHEDAEDPATQDSGDDLGDDECAYDSQEELPSVEDVLRRTAAKVTGTRFGAAAVSPVDFGARPSSRQTVSLLAPEFMDAMFRESSTTTAASVAAAARLQEQQSANYIYGRGPSTVLLSPASTYDLLDMRLFDLEHTQSFSSTISTVSSSLSSSSTARTSTSSTARSVTDEELAAAIKARELEKEVEASRQRIQELERKMEEQENMKAELSLEQQKQLSEARALIAQLQEQLKQQEQNARDAAITRDSICLTNLRQMQQQTQATPPPSSTPEPAGSRSQRSNSVEAESEALRQKLRLLERQLQQAGINVAEVIPYAVAKKRILDISRRMTEISEAEAAMKVQNPKGVVALRREYYALEQDMERFHTALLMSDEYIEEQAAKDREWEQSHALANAQALRTVRSALPVDISRLSEQALRAMATPSGRPMSADLARRFKRTNVLQLLRVAPQTIVRMHPSVIESYRTAGLTLLERRALHVALKGPASEWQQQSRDEIAQKKHAWFKKLKDAFVQSLHAYEHHIVKHHMGDDAPCPFIGKMCVVRAEQAVAQLYAAQLGFPEGDEYLEQEIIKSDPEGAGEKALEEAKAQAQAAAKLSVRQTELKAHYGLRNVRLVTMAIAALEAMDAAMERVRALDAEAAVLVAQGPLTGEPVLARWWRLCSDIVNEVRELTLQLARRAGICLSGKRDPAKDAYDNRSRLEAQSSYSALMYLDALVEDLTTALADLAVPASASQLKSALPRIRELLVDVQDKNEALLFDDEDGDAPLRRSLTPVLEADSDDDDSSDVGVEDRVFQRRSRDVVSTSPPRIPWKERQLPGVTTEPSSHGTEVEQTSVPKSASAEISPPVVPARIIPQGSALLDAIRAKRGGTPDAANGSSDVAKVAPEVPVPTVVPAVAATATEPIHVAVKKAVDAAPKANDLFAAIRAKRSAIVEAANVPEVVSPQALVTEAPPTPVVVEYTEPVKIIENEKTTDEAPKANNLLAAIRARKAKANAVSAVAPVDSAVTSA